MTITLATVTTGMVTFARVTRRGLGNRRHFARQMSSWRWQAMGPLNSRCLRVCLSLSCRCTGRWRSRPRWTARPRPPRSPPGCHHSRHGAPSHWTVSGCPSEACGPLCHCDRRKRVEERSRTKIINAVWFISLQWLETVALFHEWLYRHKHSVHKHAFTTFIHHKCVNK